MNILSGIVMGNNASGGASSPGVSSLWSTGILIFIMAVMYFVMIRPQRKKDKEVQQMRNSIQVGDEIITIGGICGKVVKTKDETIVIQVGAEKNKLEMTRWSISSISKPSGNRDREVAADKVEEEEQPKKALPKRLRKSTEEFSDEE